MTQHPHILTPQEYAAGQRNPKTVALIKALGPILRQAIDAAISAELQPLRQRIEALERERGKDAPR